MFNIEKYYKLFQMQEKQVMKYMSLFLRSQAYRTIHHTRDFIFAPGEIPVLMVAHADTVHEIHRNKAMERAKKGVEIYNDREKTTIWSPQGLGADDRAGIIAILETIKKGTKPHILVTTGEETGGIGARAFCRSKLLMRHLPKFMLEVDRQGLDEVVYYECDGGNPEFEEFIQETGFQHDWGTYSDISTIMEEYEICGANLSAGYFDEHTKQERLNYVALYNTIEKVQKLLLEAGNLKPFKFKNVPDVRFLYSDRYADVENYDPWFDEKLVGKYPSEEEYCQGCQTMLYHHTEFSYGYCLNCLSKPGKRHDNT